MSRSGYSEDLDNWDLIGIAAYLGSAEYKALAADAERYRWFRHMWLHIEYIPDQIVCAESTEQFDTAIDAARGGAVIKRYDCYSLTSCYSELRAFSREESDGDWVSYEDHAEAIADIQARLAECERERDAEKASDAESIRMYQEARDERDTLRAQLAETQRLLEVQLAVGDKLTAEVAKHEAFEASMRCPQCDLLRLEIGELIGDAEIGRRWRSNSSLEEWFPLSAEELKSAKADVTRLNKLSRMALSQKVSIVDTGVIPYRVCLNGQVLGGSLREVIDKAIIYPPEE